MPEECGKQERPQLGPGSARQERQQSGPGSARIHLLPRNRTRNPAPSIQVPDFFVSGKTVSPFLLWVETMFSPLPRSILRVKSMPEECGKQERQQGVQAQPARWPGYLKMMLR